MNQEDNQLHLKQEIIKAEILDKNYDKDKFLQFIVSKKEQGDDLSRWSLLELNEAILEFTKAEQNEQQAQSIEQIQQKVESQQINLDIEKIKGMEAKEIYEKEIVCKKLERTPLNDQNVQVVLRNPKLSDKSLLQSTYVTYEVVTESMQWLVRRRFSDFEWLRTILVKCYPRLLVPPIPGKKIGQRRFEEDFIEKRMKFLQKFIDSVMESEEFKTSEALVAFLSMIDRGQFDSKMKEMTTYQPSPYAEDLKTLTGKLTVVDQDNEKYYENINNYFTLQGQLFDRINYNFKNFNVNISAACNNLNEIQKDFSVLAQLNNKVVMVS